MPNCVVCHRTVKTNCELCCRIVWWWSVDSDAAVDSFDLGGGESKHVYQPEMPERPYLDELNWYQCAMQELSQHTEGYSSWDSDGGSAWSVDESDYSDLQEVSQHLQAVSQHTEGDSPVDSEGSSGLFDNESDDSDRSDDASDVSGRSDDGVVSSGEDGESRRAYQRRIKRRLRREEKARRIPRLERMRNFTRKHKRKPNPSKHFRGLFAYEDSRRGSKVEEHYLGGMSETCPHCGVKKFKHELKWATMCCKGHNGCNVNDVQRELSPMQPRTTEARAALNNAFLSMKTMLKLEKSSSA
jgi:hypothetical protein